MDDQKSYYVMEKTDIATFQQTLFMLKHLESSDVLLKY